MLGFHENANSSPFRGMNPPISTSPRKLGTLMMDDIEMFILRRRLNIRSNLGKLCLGSPGSTSRLPLASLRKLTFAQRI